MQSKQNELHNLNELYVKLSIGEITIEEAGKQVIKCIYLAPKLFNTIKMHDDERSEFILFLLGKMQKIILNYSKGLSSFSTYLTNVVKNLQKSWYRQYYHKQAQQESVKYYYKMEKAELFSCDNTEDYCVTKYDNNASGKKISDDDILKIMVIALKSCYYLTPHHIRLLAKKTGYSEDEIYELKAELEKPLENKIKRYLKDQESINSAYIKRNRCRIELMCIDNDSSMGHQIKKSYDHYTRLWHVNVQKHNKLTYVKPSNIQISRILHVKEHKVYHILDDMKKLQQKNLPLF